MVTGAGRRVDAGSAPSRGHRPSQTAWDPVPGIRAQSWAPAWPEAREARAGPPCFPGHSLGWWPIRGRTSRVASGGRLTYMAGVAGRGLGRGSDGGGGGDSRWLRLALATRDWKMAAARHPHPGTAAWAGRGRRHVASGPRGRGAAGPGVVQLGLSALGCERNSPTHRRPQGI